MFVFLHVCLVNPALQFVTLQTVVCQASLSVGFFKGEYWSELLFPPPMDLPDPRIEPISLISLFSIGIVY